MAVARLLAAHDIWVSELVPDADDLEAVYLRTLDDQASDRGDRPREGGR